MVVFKNEWNPPTLSGHINLRFEEYFRPYRVMFNYVKPIGRQWTPFGGQSKFRSKARAFRPLPWAKFRPTVTDVLLGFDGAAKISYGNFRVDRAAACYAQWQFPMLS